YVGASSISLFSPGVTGASCCCVRVPASIEEAYAVARCRRPPSHASAWPEHQRVVAPWIPFRARESRPAQAVRPPARQVGRLRDLWKVSEKGHFNPVTTARLTALPPFLEA